MITWHTPYHWLSYDHVTRSLPLIIIWSCDTLLTIDYHMIMWHAPYHWLSYDHVTRSLPLITMIIIWSRDTLYIQFSWMLLFDDVAKLPHIEYINNNRPV